MRVIAEAVEGMSGRIEEALQAHGFALAIESGNRSAGGKYISYPLSLRMESLEQMQAVDRTLRALRGVKMVL